ncbi:signal peptidase II [candidate division KSB1 bacterium]|nr:signal peptidase II [candidate division KSB1 bacterium]
MKNKLLALGISGLIVIVDQITKMCVRYFMEIDQTVSVFGKLVELHYILNPGMAFGFEVGNRFFYIFFTSLACLIVLIFLFKLDDVQRWPRYTLAFILGGAIGNLIDRIFVGKVLDFIKVGFWPIFNVADIMVTIGMTVLIIIVLFEKKQDDEIFDDELEIN